MRIAPTAGVDLWIQGQFATSEVEHKDGGTAKVRQMKAQGYYFDDLTLEDYMSKMKESELVDDSVKTD
jgi:hypothetical protein